MGLFANEVAKAERAILVQVLEECSRDGAAAAKILGLSPQMLLDKAREHGIAVISINRRKPKPTRRRRGKLVTRILALERKRILEALSATDGQVTLAAQLLGVTRASMYRRLKHHDIEFNAAKGLHSTEGHEARDLPAEIRALETRAIRKALDGSATVMQAARELGISRSTLNRKCQQYGIALNLGGNG